MSNAAGKIGTSSVSNIEVGCLVGTNDLIQTELNSKANQSTTYSKTEVDSNLALKANQATTFSKTEVDNKLVLKANQSTTYTKTEVDNSLALRQNKLSFPSNEGSNGWGVIADATNTVRRLVGAQPIRTFIELELNNPSSINDVQIGLDIDLTRLTSYSTKTETGN